MRFAAPGARFTTAEHAVDRDWMVHAQCKHDDPEIWFPDNSERRFNSKDARAQRLLAVAICVQCPVRAECLSYALTINATCGIYGGLDESERKQLTRRAKQ